MKVFVTTTGAASPLVFTDLAARTITHPTTNLELTLEFALEELRKSTNLKSYLDLGYIILKDEDGNVLKALTSIDDITVGVSSDDTTPSFLFDKVQAGTGINFNIINPGANEKIQIVNTSTGKTSWAWVAARSTNSGLSQDLRYADGLPTNESALVTPFDCTLTAITAGTQTAISGDNWTVSILKNDVEVATLNLVNQVSKFVTGLSVAFLQGDRLRIRGNVTGGNMRRPHATVFFVES